MNDTKRTTPAPESTIPHARRTAICCVCGALRQVSVNYFGQVPDEWRHQEGWQFLAALKCAACKPVTRHALVLDGAADGHETGTDWAELRNRERDRARRRIARRLASFERNFEIDVRWQATLKSGDSVEVLQYREEGRVWFLLRLEEGCPPERLASALDKAEDVLDEPDRLGPWRASAHGTGLTWRGAGVRR